MPSLSKVCTAVTSSARDRRETNHLSYPGIAYTLPPLSEVRDRLKDTKQCEIDAKLMADIGVNTVRVYQVEAKNSHDGCMEAFDKQGIYVWIELDSGFTSFDSVGIP